MKKKDKEEQKKYGQKISSMLNKIDDLESLSAHTEQETREIKKTPPEFMKYAPSKHFDSEQKASSAEDDYGSMSIPFEIPNVDRSPPLADETSLVHMKNLSQTIEATTHLIKDLIEANESLKKNAKEIINSLEIQLSEEKSYSARITDEYHALKRQSAEIQEKDALQKQELENFIHILEARLEQARQELSAAGNFIENINRNINDSLAEAIDFSKKIIK